MGSTEMMTTPTGRGFTLAIKSHFISFVKLNSIEVAWMNILKRELLLSFLVENRYTLLFLPG